MTINFGREPENNCIPFTSNSAKSKSVMKMNKNKNGISKSGASSPGGKKVKEVWGPFRLFDPTLRTFDARVGPSGGRKGYTGTTGAHFYRDFDACS